MEWTATKPRSDTSGYDSAEVFLNRIGVCVGGTEREISEN